MLDAYNRYVGMTGAVFDNKTSFLRITPAQFQNLQSLFFDIGSSQYELNANAQIWPRAYNNVIGGETDGIYLVVYDVGQVLSQELGFIAGMALLERLYCVFDTTNSRVGFATTQFTSANTN
jgi:cathepsin E